MPRVGRIPEDVEQTVVSTRFYPYCVRLPAAILVCGRGTQIPLDDAPRQVHGHPDFHTLLQTYSVSRVEVDTRRFPQWVTIFFKESPDATFGVCSPSPGIFRERVGQDLSTLIGKTLEVAGNVEPSRCAGKAASISVNLSYPNGWRMH